MDLRDLASAGLIPPLSADLLATIEEGERQRAEWRAGHEARGEWLEALLTLDSHEGVPYVIEHADAIEAAGLYSEAVADAWTTEDNPSRHPKIRVVRMFLRAGFISDRPGVTNPAPVRVWRGVRDERGPGRVGFSWTTDIECARFFARGSRYSTPGAKGRVYEAVATVVFACLFEREESEVVVDPFRLRDVRLVERVVA